MTDLRPVDMGPFLSGEDEYDDGLDRACTICGGDWYMQECDDPIQCCDPKCDGQWHPCVACNGTGLAEHQWMW